MKSSESEAKTKEEAVQKALQELNLSRARVSVEVLEEGTKGFLGMGSKPVRVRVRELGDDESAPVEVVNTLLEMMDVKFELSVSQDEEATNIRIDAPEDDGLLIGRRGQTLDALRHLSQRIVAAQRGHNVIMNIDVGDYRARREEALRERAESAAEAVLSSGRSVTLDPMSAQDRRVIHLVLAERGDLHTFTVGGGTRRRVVVAPEGSRGRDRDRDRDGEDRGRGRGRDRERRGRDREERPRERDSQPSELKTAYDQVPDPGFRPARLDPVELPEREEKADGRESGESQRRRRPRRRGGHRSRDERGGDSRGAERRDTERPDSEHRDGERREGGQREGERRDDRAPRHERSSGRSHEGGRDRAPDRERRPSRDSRSRDAGRSRDRDSYRDEEAREPLPDEEPATLSEQPVVEDESTEKPFSKDLARQILKLDSKSEGPGDSGGSSRRPPPRP